MALSLYFTTRLAKRGQGTYQLFLCFGLHLLIADDILARLLCLVVLSPARACTTLGPRQAQGDVVRSPEGQLQLITKTSIQRAEKVSMQLALRSRSALGMGQSFLASITSASTGSHACPFRRDPTQVLSNTGKTVASFQISFPTHTRATGHMWASAVSRGGPV